MARSVLRHRVDPAVHMAIDGLDVDVGASIGVALCPDNGEDPATLLQRADVAMYSAKRGAGVELYDSERDHYSPRLLRMVGELGHARRVPRCAPVSRLPSRW